MNFKEWVSSFRYDNDIVGDFASDIYKDENFPLTKDKNVILDYFDSLSVNQKIIDVFNYLWVFYIRGDK